MKHFTPLFFAMALFVFSSCHTYYYTSVNSYGNQLPGNKDGSFTTSANNLAVTYSFKDDGGNLVYEINNQSDDPVFVDWSRSVLIVEDNALQYRQNKAYLEGTVNTTTYRFSDSDFGIASGSISGQIVLPQPDIFIPPNSKTRYSPVALSGMFNPNVQQLLLNKIEVGGKQFPCAEFTEDNTPLKFRSYLTIINDITDVQTIFEDTFYISRIIKTGSQNMLLMRDVNHRGDTFYIDVVNQKAAIAGWIGVGVGALGVGILLKPDMPEHPEFSF